MELIFATHNLHKAEEVRAILGSNYHIKSLHEIGCPDIPETADTLKGNALQKAQYVFDHYHVNCFADDTGLEVEALDGRPGVYSARYAGEGCTYQDNVLKMLEEMRGVTNRKASFKTIIALILDGKQYFFEGRVDGEILTEQRGTDGFGYDPIFKPLGFRQTYAEMSAMSKNTISHRARAMQQLKTFLMEYTK
jgi:XTP/dITP diphosphohydrolase